MPPEGGRKYIIGLYAYIGMNAPNHSYHSENTAAPLCIVNRECVLYGSIAGLSGMLGLREGGAQMVDDAEAARANSDTHLLITLRQHPAD